MTKVIDVKDDILLPKTEDKELHYTGNKIHANVYQFKHYLRGNLCNKVFNFIIRDRCSSGMLLRIWLVVTYRRVGPTDRSRIQGKTSKNLGP